jgi:hypothetical protein
LLQSILQYQVVVGDRKSYDHLIKLKSEYGGSLSWVLPYHGDWHILFFNLIFQSETFCEEYSVFKTVAFESAVSSKTSIEQNSDFSVSVSENERKVQTIFFSKKYCEIISG